METSKKKHSYRTFFLTSFFISLIALPTAFSVAGSDDLRFYAISNHDCKSCVRAVQLLLDLYGEKVTVYDIKEDDNAKRFDIISSIAGSEVYTAIPLVVVFQNERLVAIVFGFHSEENWAKIVKTKYNGVPIYSNLYMGGEIIPDKILTEQNVTDSIARLFIDAPLDGDIDGAKGHRDIYSLLPLIVMAAAADAVNPCEFYVLAVFLSLIFFRIGRRAVLKAGTAYATAIFAVYYLMGFGLLGLISYARQMRFFVVMVFGVFGLFVGFREILGTALNREFKRVPDAFSEKLSAYLRKVSENPMTAFIVGIISGVFLMPCTSGPYFIALSLIADLKSVGRLVSSHGL